MDNNSSILISIILPVYNGEKYLAKSIESCLCQTHKNIELIVVNDASTDSTLDIALGYAKADQRIKIISNEINKKLPASLNFGHKVASGKFITWTSHDNYYSQNALAILLESLIRENVEICFSNFAIVDENDNELRKYTFSESNSILLENIVGACFLYKMKVFDSLTGYDENLFRIEDYAFWLMASKDFKFYHVSEDLYFYRSHKDSLTAKKTIKQFIYDEAYVQKVQDMYTKFFKSFEIENLNYISALFKDLHLHQKISISEILNKYNELNSFLRPVLCKYGEEKIKNEIDLRLRYNILRFKANQNIRTLVSIIKNRPKILYAYSLKKSIIILLRCLKIEPENIKY